MCVGKAWEIEKGEGGVCGGGGGGGRQSGGERKTLRIMEDGIVNGENISHLLVN